MLTGIVRSWATPGAVALTALILGYVIATNTYNIQGYVVVVLAMLVVVVLVAMPRIAASEGRAVLWIIGVALLVKAGASLFHLYWGFEVKQGIGEGSRYHANGELIAEGIWRLDFEPVVTAFEIGTGFIDVATGFLYAIIGPTLLGGALVFAWVAMFGSLLYYKAFRLAFPEGNKVLYAMLVFLYPSLVYWPAIQGKDALMALWIGLFAYGLALLLRLRSLKGIILLSLGIGGVFLIRPHIAAMLILPAVIAIAARPFKFSPTSLATRILVLLVMTGLCWVMVTKALEFLDLETLSVRSTLDLYDYRVDVGVGGGSAYNPPSIRDPLGLPKQVITVLFRPFPWEAHRLAALVLSFEGLSLLGLSIYRVGAIKRALGSLNKDPYVVFIVLFVLIFMVAFMPTGNFSLLGRQRLQMFPLFFMLLAYPWVTEAVRHVGAKRTAPHAIWPINQADPSLPRLDQA